MKSISNSIAKLLVKNGADPEMEEVYAYGIECTLSTLLILALLMTAGFILRKPLQMLVFILAWLPLRMLVGGAHANTHWMCTLVSVGLGTVSVMFCAFLNRMYIAFLMMMPLSVVCCVILFLIAPVIHKNHPISMRRYRKTRIIARIYTAAECAVVILIVLSGSRMIAPAFMGFFTTTVLAVIGWFSKNTDKTFMTVRKQ